MNKYSGHFVVEIINTLKDINYSWLTTVDIAKQARCPEPPQTTGSSVLYASDYNVVIQ